MPPSDTFFTAPPEWGWWVVLYFFFGGLAGGSYFLSSLLGAFGTEADKPLARVGHYVAFVAVLLCAPLLIIDLNRPERFWHMIIQSETGLPMFKLWSPMSAGSWALMIFGLFAFVSFIGALIESGRLRWRPPEFLTSGIVRNVFNLLGTMMGFFLASYTGVLLATTNRPIWSDSPLLGLLFLVSAASTSAALLMLLGRRLGPAASAATRWLRQMDVWVMILEVVVIIALVLTLGAVSQVWLSAWGIALLVGVLLVGIAVPLLLHWRPRMLGRATLPAAAAAVLIGGFILRAVIVFSAQSV